MVYAVASGPETFPVTDRHLLGWVHQLMDALKVINPRVSPYCTDGKLEFVGRSEAHFESVHQNDGLSQLGSGQFVQAAALADFVEVQEAQEGAAIRALVRCDISATFGRCGGDDGLFIEENWRPSKRGLGGIGAASCSCGSELGEAFRSQAQGVHIREQFSQSPEEPRNFTPGLLALLFRPQGTHIADKLGLLPLLLGGSLLALDDIHPAAILREQIQKRVGIDICVAELLTGR